MALSVALREVQANPTPPQIEKSLSTEEPTVNNDPMKRHFLIRHEPDKNRWRRERQSVKLRRII